VPGIAKTVSGICGIVYKEVTMAECRYCSYLDRSDTDKYGDCYCSYLGKYVDPASPGCSKNDKEADGEDHSGGCYLTTAMCGVLGKADDCFELEKLRAFRENYMRKTDEGQKLLAEYDTISPPIAKKLEQSDNRIAIAEKMLRDFIDPAINLIFNGENQQAIEKYKEMVYYVKRELDMG